MMRFATICFGAAGLAAAATAQDAWSTGFAENQLGLSGPVSQLLPFGNELIAVGTFTQAGSERANYVAAFDGFSWRRLGEGGAFGGGGFSNAAYCATVFRGQLIAGGFFTQLGRAGGTTVNRVAAWDGTRWLPLGACPGVTGSFGQVRAMTVYNDRLYVGGGFAQAGCVQADNLASWDGTAWSGVTGVGGETDGFVDALAVHDGMLVIGGEFDHAGPLAARGLAAINGSTFTPIAGPGLSFIGKVSSLASIGGSLYAGGNFDSVNGVAAADIARYDGTWHPLDGGMFGVDVAAIAEYNGRIFAGGLFSDAGGVQCNDIAAWDGQGWSALGSGLNGIVVTAAEYRGSLFVGGSFTNASGVPSSRIARWGPPSCPVDFDGNGFVDFFDYLDYLAAFENADPRADLNGDEFIDFFDYLDFVNVFEVGC